MKIYKILLASGLLLSLSSCEGFLNRPPMDQVENSADFYNKETTLRAGVQGMYGIHFGGYETGWSRSRFGNQTSDNIFSDDLAQSAASQMTKQAPATGGGWDFSRVKKMNILIEGLKGSTLNDEAKNHWMGVYRFFRALENAALINKFGDIPYYDTAPLTTDTESLFKAQEDRAVNMKRVFEDLDYASQHVRVNDDVKGVTVNQDVVNAKAAQIMLFEGSWQKYHEQNNEHAKYFFQKARDFAKKVIDSKRYKISDDYRALFTSEDLAGNPEIILYRSYIEGKATHSVMSFDIEQPQNNAPSKSLVESYRTTNGLPIAQTGNDLYKGDKVFTDEMANRDPRLGFTIDPTEAKYNNFFPQYAITGYLSHKYVKYDYIGKPEGQSSTNTMDSPVLRYAEVLLIYAEAVAELGEMTQSDMDISINAIRARKGVEMPPLQVSGTNVSVNGQQIDDPAKDPDVSSLIWEIRNERRVELALEGFRYDDLRRWKQLEKADNEKNPKQNMGAYADLDALLTRLNKADEEAGKLDDQKKAQNEKTIKEMKVHGGNRQGYLMPTVKNFRVVEPKHYLSPIPTDQLQLYKDKGFELKQNPGW